MDTTLLIIKNSYFQPIKVFITLLGDPDYFLTDIQNIPFVTNFTHKDSGYFIINPGQYVSYSEYNKKGTRFNISFGDSIIKGPSDEYPCGINFADIKLNNILEGLCASESISINCVNGINSIMKISMISGGVWNVENREGSINTIQNEELGNNTGIIGVYPYGCDMCTNILKPYKRVDSPISISKEITPQKESICEVKRKISENGGMVFLEFLEFTKNVEINNDFSKDKKGPKHDVKIDEPVDDICCWKFC